MRAILFDKDGTLFDFEATWLPVLERLALEAAGGDPAAANSLLEAGGLDRSTGRVRSGSVIGADTTAAITRLWHPGLSGAAFDDRVSRMDAAFRDHGARHSVTLPGILATLAGLAETGYVMGVATNDATQAALAALAATGIDRYVRHVFGCDSVARPKPAPDMVEAFAKAIGVPIAEIVVVGDNRHDLEMARTAGAVAIGVTSGNSAAGDLAPHADAVLASVRDLPGWLARISDAR
ncbi:MAG: HAD family hydrolase [Bauldia sp.]